MDQTAAQISSPADHPASSLAHIDLKVGGMTCRHCPPMVERALEGTDGVYAAQVNLSTGTAGIDYDPDRTSAGDLAKAIRSAGYSSGTARTSLRIKKLHCASCVTSSVHKIGGHPSAIAER